MKILFVLPSFNLSGGIRVVAIYAEKLLQRGHDVNVVGVLPKKPTWRERFRALVRGKGWLTWDKTSSSHFDSVNVPHRIVNHSGPITDVDVPDADIVIATWWETAEWVARLSPRKGIKAYFIQHHEVFDYLPVDRVRATYRLPLYKITIAQWLVEIMANQYGDRHVSLVPNSVDLKQFYASVRSKRAQPQVGFFYSTVNWKGCDISLNAFEIASRTLPNLRLITFSATPPSETLPLPPLTNHILCPSNETLKDIYASCDAWLFGSREEGFGLPILEAMACRTPVIATPAGASPELVSQGGGLLVKPEDPEDMARAIVRICQMSDPEWQAMSEAAYQTASRYTWEDATDRLEQALYTAIARQKESHAGI